MARFIALPVGQGDAFFLETDKGSVLVDGGRSKKRIAGLFRRYTNQENVCILVVTHNDADHANGILGLLDSELTCKEIWLPGRWVQVLPQVLRPQEEVVHMLIEQVEEVQADELKPEGLLLEQYAEKVSLHTEAVESAGEVWKLDESGWPHKAFHLLEAASEEEEGGLVDSIILWQEDKNYILVLKKCLLLARCKLSDIKYRLLQEALVAARRIRQIALAAYHRGIPVRWFEFNPTNPGGGNNWLQPLNSQQIMHVKPVRDIAFLRMLALSVSNRESLVFWAPSGCTGGGVLFTADSDLQGIHLPRLDGAIVTAPHHGSEANRQVYFCVQNRSVNESVTWVRSDGRYRKRPCLDYLKQKNRFCTLCRNSKDSKQAVELLYQSGAWNPSNTTRQCSCK